MEYAGEEWVKRLRAGRVPPARGVVIAVIALIVIGGVLLALEWTHTSVFTADIGSRGQFSAVVGPPALVVGGVVLAIATWFRQRSDRELVGRILRSGPVALFVPVVGKAPFVAETLPEPRPSLWTVDAAGLHGWVRSREKPVIEVPWSEIDSFEHATNTGPAFMGQRTDYGIRVIGARGTSTRILRSLQRQLDPAHAGHPPLE